MRGVGGLECCTEFRSLTRIGVGTVMAERKPTEVFDGIIYKRAVFEFEGAPNRLAGRYFGFPPANAFANQRLT